MNLGELLDFCGNLLDYDPSNDTYRSQLVSLLNDAQTRTLTDRPWAFASRDRKLRVFTDTTPEPWLHQRAGTGHRVRPAHLG